MHLIPRRLQGSPLLLLWDLQPQAANPIAKTLGVRRLFV